MSTAPSKYALNQFESGTRERYRLMTAVLNDAFIRLGAAATFDTAFGPALAEVATARANWIAGMTAIANEEALQLSKTPAVEEKLASLTRKPDMETASPLESWDNTIRSVAPQGSSLYILLLPHGRETLTKGSIGERIDAIRDFALRLAAQAAKPALMTLGSAEVEPFATALETLRTEQETAKANVADLRGGQENLRLAAAAALYYAVSVAMGVYRFTPERVDEVFDVNLLRSSAQEIPVAPADTAWDAPTRTLSVTEMPPNATRLVAYRQGAGDAPELLAEGMPDELTVGIPSSYLFNTGESYDLWLAGKNARGIGPKGPVVVWVP